MAGSDRPKLVPVLQATPTDRSQKHQFLSVDETKRPRANSDPVGLHLGLSPLPEIMVTADDGQDQASVEDGEMDKFLLPPSPRRRANTCPEDMFRARKGRPPTPPPTDIQVIKNPAGKRFSFNFTPKDLNGVSFAHHKLSKVSEDMREQRQCDSPDLQGASASGWSSVSGSQCQGLSRLQGHQSQTSEAKQSSEKQLKESIQHMSLSTKTPSGNKNNNVSTDGNKCTHTDSWRSKENSRDSLDTSRLTAH